MACLPVVESASLCERSVTTLRVPSPAKPVLTVDRPHTKSRRAVRNVRIMTPISGLRFRHPAEESNPVLQIRSLPCDPVHLQGITIK